MSKLSVLVDCEFVVEAGGLGCAVGAMLGCLACDFEACALGGGAFVSVDYEVNKSRSTFA